MGAEARRIRHVDAGASDRFLEIAHDVQMPNEPDRAVFCKFDPQFHDFGLVLDYFVWIASFLMPRS